MRGGVWVMAAVCAALAVGGCGGGDAPRTQATSETQGGGGAGAAVEVAEKPFVMVRPSGAATTQPRNAEGTPVVLPAKGGDAAGVTAGSDPVEVPLNEAILRSSGAGRKTAVPFFKMTIPDPDDRANMPSMPAAPETMPAVPEGLR